MLIASQRTDSDHHAVDTTHGRGVTEMELVLLAGPYGQVMERLIALGCGVPISIGVILLGASWIVGSLRIARKGKMTVGQVVRIEKRWGDEPGGTDTPIVRFTEEREGRAIEIDTGMGSTPLPWRFAVGDRVHVVYLPQQPEVARIQSFGSMWGGALLLIAGGLAGAGIVLALLFS
jgi:hypothetical protein